MSQKKKGFTLVEVLVVMLVATLVFTTVGGTMVFVTTTTDSLIQQAEEIDTAKNIEKYLRSLKVQDIKNFVTFDEGTILFGEEVIFSDTGLIDFVPNEIGDDGFFECRMEFESGRQFEFILYEVKE